MRSTMNSRWRLRVSLMALRIHISLFYLLSFIFVRHFRYVITFVTFISIHLVIIFVVLLWRTYETHPSLPLKSGCDNGGFELSLGVQLIN
jgi:phosphoglycerol transferase MdoB-like AlkP superfamily enzyme